MFFKHFKSFKQCWRNFFNELFLREKGAIFFFLFVVLSSLIFLFVNFASVFTKETPKEGGIYTEGAIGQPQLINPLYAPSSITDRSISYLVYSGLTRIDEEGNAEKDLAEGWAISEDKKSYDLRLKKDLYWHDGQPLFSGDILYTYKSIQDPDYGGPLKGQFKDVSITISDEYNVKFELSQPDKDFLKKLTVGILPQHIWAQQMVSDMPYLEENLRPIGSGAFKFKELKTDEEDKIISLSLERNESYYAQKPYLKMIIFKFLGNGDEISDALIEGEINGTQNISYSSIGNIQSLDRMRIYSYELPGYKAVFFNENHNDFLKQKDLRVAMDQSIDKDRLVNKELGGQGSLLSGFFPTDVNKSDYEERLQDAQEKIKKIGGVDKDENGILEIGDKPLEFTIKILNEEESRIVANRLKEDFSKIGISLTVEEFNSLDFEEDILKPRNYEMIFLGQNYGENVNLFSFWHSSQWKNPGLMFTSINSKRVDGLLENYVGEGKEENLSEYRNAISAIVSDNRYALFLYQPYHTFITHTDIKGISKDPFLYPEHRFIDVSSWYIETKKVFLPLFQ